MLITRARLQDYTETQYAALVSLAREGMGFLASIRAGDVITQERIAQRDDLARRAERFLSDVPVV
jgi:hypothetical protein